MGSVMKGHVTVPPDSISVVVDMVISWVVDVEELLPAEFVVVEDGIVVEIKLLFSNDWSSIQRLQRSWLYGSGKFS